MILGRGRSVERQQVDGMKRVLSDCPGQHRTLNITLQQHIRVRARAHIAPIAMPWKAWPTREGGCVAAWLWGAAVPIWLCANTGWFFSSRSA